MAKILVTTYDPTKKIRVLGSTRTYEAAVALKRKFLVNTLASKLSHPRGTPMKKLTLMLALLASTATAVPTHAIKLVPFLRNSLHVTDLYPDRQVMWGQEKILLGLDFNMTGSDDKQRAIVLIATHAPGKSHAALISIQSKVLSEDTPLGVSEAMSLSGVMSAYCFGLTDIDGLVAWDNAKYNDALKTGGGSYTHTFGHTTVKLEFRISGSGVTVREDTWRADRANPGSAAYPVYCTVK